MDIFRFADLNLLTSKARSHQGKKESQKLKSSELNKLHQEGIGGVPMKSLLAQEMSKQKESKKRSSPSIIARLMGLDVLPPQSSSSSSHRQQHKSVKRSSKDEQKKFKDVFEVSDNRRLYHHHHQEKVNAATSNLTQAELGFIRQKFMEAKRLSTDEKLRNSKEYNDAIEALDSNKDLLLKFLQHPDSLFTKHLHDLQTKPQHSQRHKSPVGSGSSRSYSRHVSYETYELQPTKIVVLKPNLGDPRYRTFVSPSSSSDEFRADRRLPCTSKHFRQRSNESIRLSKQRKTSHGYAGDESSSGSDSLSETELVTVTSRTRANYHRSLPSKSNVSSVSKEAKMRLSERWKLTHKYEQEIEIRRSETLADMLATSDKEARPASFNGLVFDEGISRRVKRSDSIEPVGISSRDGWKRDKTIMNKESTYGGYTIVLPKELIVRDGLVKGSSSSRRGSTRSSSSYDSPSLGKFRYMKNEIQLSPIKGRRSFSVDVSSDSDSSACDDIKTAMSSEAPDLSTVTSLTDPDISRMPTEDVNQSSVPEPETKKGDQPSPVSVLETFDNNDDVSSSSECFESVSADLQGLRRQLQLLKLESDAYNEGAMLVSSDEESSIITDEALIADELGGEDWKSLYLVDLLANSKLSDLDNNNTYNTVMDSSLFDDLEKKFSIVTTSTRLERKFLFNQISIELNRMLNQFSDPYPWVKSTRVSQKWDANKIQETLRDLVTRKDERPGKDEEELQWLSLEDDIDIIGRDIEDMLTDELIAEFVVDAIF